MTADPDLPSVTSGLEMPMPARRSGADNPLRLVPVEMAIVVGKARLTIGELVKLRRDSVLPLDKKIDDPVEIYVADKLIALGELQEIQGESGSRLAVRLTEIIGLSGAD